MAKKINVTLLLIASILLFSMCKKSSTTTNNTNNSTINVAKSYYGVFNVYGNQYVFSHTVTPLSIISQSVFFTGTPITSDTLITPYITVNNVNLNGVNLKCYSNGYFDTTLSSTTLPNIWNVVGLGIIPSFTYTNNTPMPTYSDYNFLPDTIYKSKQNTIQITGITGSDVTTVYVIDGVTGEVTQKLSSGATSVSFSASSLASLSSGITPGTTSIVRVVCIKNNIQTFSGKNFNFPFTYIVDKDIYIK